jgi:GNAT superfamily N-acetyltransferase
MPGAEVAATEQGLLKTLHFSDEAEPGTKRFAWPLLIFGPHDDPAGLLVYFHNYSTWAAAPGVCLEELYVVPAYRRHGYARVLIEAMARAAKAAGCVKMDWVCLLSNDKALSFYDKLGAKRMEDWIVFKVDEGRTTQLSKRSIDQSIGKGN